jgi:hypothetical protein
MVYPFRSPTGVPDAMMNPFPGDQAADIVIDRVGELVTDGTAALREIISRMRTGRANASPDVIERAYEELQNGVRELDGGFNDAHGSTLESMDEYVRRYRRGARTGTEFADFRYVTDLADYEIGAVEKIVSAANDVGFPFTRLDDRFKKSLLHLYHKHFFLEELRSRYRVMSHPGDDPGTPRSRADLAAISRLAESMRQLKSVAKDVGNTLASYMGQPPL